MDTFQSLLIRQLNAALTKAGLPAVGEVTPATDARFGDYQTNAAMVLGKQHRQNPRDVAATIIEHLDVGQWSESPTVAGAGFINFRLRQEALEQKLAELGRDDRLGVAQATSRQRIGIDFGSPNV